MNKGQLLLEKTIILILFTGCVNNPMLPSHLNNSSEQKALIFKTNPATFISELNIKTDKIGRNSYITEFILKSDIQCRSYLAIPVSKPKTDVSQNQLYMNIFDTVSTVFGLGYITNTAKSMLSGDGSNNLENQEEYKKALSPEIKRGVEINRERYAKKIKSKEKLSIKEYPITQLRKDMLIYDKQCNEAYGLIEINRALKAMQQNLNRPQIHTKSTINLEAVKQSVTETTKKVQAKEKEKEKEKAKAKVNSSPKRSFPPITTRDTNVTTPKL
jgi:hypothetical protein